MTSWRVLGCLAAGLVASGCASTLEGTTQTITLMTNPPGATCKLLREGQAIASVTTPGGTVVKKTKHDIRVECEKEGYETSTDMLKSGIEGATWGNIILGGGIGWLIDSASGADNRYPDNLTVTLNPKLPAGNAPSSSPSAQRRLQELDSLRDRKLITPIEYDTRRKAILESL